MKKGKNRGSEHIKCPSTIKDLTVAVLVTIVIVFGLFLVHYLFGDAKPFGTNITSLLGAILAVSGLMLKQYLFKENIEYLGKWVRLENSISKILSNSSSDETEVILLLEKLSARKSDAISYANYVKRELRIIPVVPMILVVLYGAALIATDSLTFRMLCLGLMLLLVVYLAIATISSSNLAIEEPNLDQTINELDELMTTLKKSKDVEQLQD